MKVSLTQEVGLRQRGLPLHLLAIWEPLRPVCLWSKMLAPAVGWRAAMTILLIETGNANRADKRSSSYPGSAAGD